MKPYFRYKANAVVENIIFNEIPNEAPSSKLYQLRGSGKSTMFREAEQHYTEMGLSALLLDCRDLVRDLMVDKQKGTRETFESYQEGDVLLIDNVRDDMTHEEEEAFASFLVRSQMEEQYPTIILAIDEYSVPDCLLFDLWMEPDENTMVELTMATPSRADIICFIRDRASDFGVRIPESIDFYGQAAEMVRSFAEANYVLGHFATFIEINRVTYFGIKEMQLFFKNLALQNDYINYGVNFLEQVGEMTTNDVFAFLLFLEKLPMKQLLSLAREIKENLARLPYRYEVTGDLKLQYELVNKVCRLRSKNTSN